MSFEIFIIQPSAVMGATKHTAWEALVVYKTWEAEGGDRLGIRDTEGGMRTLKELEEAAAKEV